MKTLNSHAESSICVFYDGACPSCRRDRERYRALEKTSQEPVLWQDINGHEEQLTKLGIEPQSAMLELHIQIEDKQGNRQILSEMDAYIVLMQRTLWLKPLAFIIALPLIRPLLSRLYHDWVCRRLTKQGRL